MAVKNLLSFFILLLLSSAGFAQQSLQGVEVLGNKLIARETILSGFPLQTNTPLPSDMSSLKAWCDTLEVRLHVPFARCGIVGFGGGKVYAVVDVVEAGDESKLKTPEKIPYRDIELNSDLYKLSRQLTSVWIEKLKKNAGVKSFVSRGVFLDYDDQELSLLANQLFLLASVQKQAIFDVLLYSKSESQRTEAAHLLNWCGDPQAAMIKAMVAFRDESSSVRNNLVQFISFYFSYIPSADIQHLIGDLAWQLNLPSHTDRNKALGVLFLLLKKHPEMAREVKELAEDQITYLAKNSVLPNVGGVAKKILEQLNKDAPG